MFYLLQFSFCSRWSKDYLGHIAWRPPSTGSDAPVMYDESSEARKATALATSSGCPGRPSACVSLDRSKNWRTKQEHLDCKPKLTVYIYLTLNLHTVSAIEHTKKK